MHSRLAQMRIGLAVVSLCASQAMAESWVKLGTSDSGDVWSVERDSILPDNNDGLVYFNDQVSSAGGLETSDEAVDCAKGIEYTLKINADYMRGWRDVAVAWDGSREAVRAVHDSLPLLKMAQEVHIKTLVTLPDAVEVNSLVAHLANHGIGAVAKVEQVARSDERARFLPFIAEGRYDLVVMGGFSHPKWWEFIFGGTTLSTLRTSNINVLVSH